MGNEVVYEAYDRERHARRAKTILNIDASTLYRFRKNSVRCRMSHTQISLDFMN
jgi:transposase-like protein